MRSTIQKTLSLFLAVVCLFAMMLPASAAEQTETFRLLYEIQKSDELFEEEESFAIITGYEGTVPETLIIPEEVEGHPVIAVKEKAFKNCDTIRYLVLEGENNLLLKKSSFAVCPNLETVVGNNFETGDYAFYNCTALKSVKTLGYIGRSTFNGCTSLESVHVRDNYVSVAENAFLNCCELSVVYIGGYRSYYIYDDLEFVVEGTGNGDFLDAERVADRYTKYDASTMFIKSLSYSDKAGNTLTVDLEAVLAEAENAPEYKGVKWVSEMLDEYYMDLEDKDSLVAVFHLNNAGSQKWEAQLLDEDGAVVGIVECTIEVSPTLLQRVLSVFQGSSLYSFFLTIYYFFKQLIFI